jgi:hypothetical protein
MIINDKEMASEITNDLVNNYNYTTEQAAEFVAEHGEDLVSTMWDAYSFRLGCLVEELA